MELQWRRRGVYEGCNAARAKERLRAHDLPPSLYSPHAVALPFRRNANAAAVGTPPAALAPVFLPALFSPFLARLPCIAEEGRDLFHTINMTARCQSVSRLRVPSSENAKLRQGISSAHEKAKCVFRGIGGNFLIA
jgi:hypothetical protein